MPDDKSRSADPASTVLDPGGEVSIESVRGIERFLRAVALVEQGVERCRTVEHMAAAACWSPYHFTRIFASTIGMPPGLYLRRRRLTLAARALVETETRVLEIALEAGFESQESFTRAFQLMFGLPPGRFRQSPSALDRLSQDPIDRAYLTHLMKGAVVVTPEYRTLDAFTVVGMGTDFIPPETEHLTRLWEQFNARIPAMVGEYPNVAFGVMNSLTRDDVRNDRLHYTAAIAVPSTYPVPEGMERIAIPPSRYAVFVHKGHISAFDKTMSFIWKMWAAQNADRLANTPDFERYDERFDIQTLSGEVEIWIPVIE